MTSDTELALKGTLIDGRYEIRERLGQGGMGTVYRARDMKLGQEVALKMLLHRAGSERSREERRRRFMREIYAINEVQHRNIVHIQEFGFFKDTPYMVMELLKGKDLNRVLRETADLLPVDYAVDLLLVVCAAIQACHESGVIHRDLKPGNIMVIDSDFGPGWDVKVVDFSISKVGTELTQDGQIVGTPSYLSPEQVSGKVGPGSDQYAIGLLLYVCLTKRHPFEGLDGLPLVRMIEKGEFRGPREFRPEIPEELERIVLTAMHLDPEKRYASVHELGQKLWPFGSPLGQDVWKKYYFETPGIGRPRHEARPTSTGVPLVLQMMEGRVPLPDATAVAHYQSTTSVQKAARTALDLEARAAAAEDGDAGRTAPDPGARPVSVPSGWRWESSAADRPASVGPVAVKPSAGKRVVAFAAGLAIAALLVGVAFKIGTRVTEPPAAAKASEATRAAPPPQAASPAPPAGPVSPPAPAAAPAPNAPVVAPPVAVAPERSVKPKRHDRERARRQPQRGQDWGTDPAGNPIPPL